MNILITGGTGSLGSRLVEFYTNQGWDVTVLSRDGHKQQALAERFPDAVMILGDVRDYDIVKWACMGKDCVVHTAALKIVYQGEENPEEFLSINTLGSLNVAKACYETDVPVALLIGSDKQVEPINFYGFTKAVAERIFLSYGYSVLRYGNVISGSKGSFIEIWKGRIARGEKIAIREPEPTRFFVKMDHAVELVDSALNYAIGGEVFIPRHLRAFSVWKVAEALGAECCTEPLLGGEKIHEKLLSDFEQGKIVNDLLCKVWLGYEGDLKHEDFRSENVPRMSGEEFLEQIGE